MLIKSLTLMTDGGGFGQGGPIQMRAPEACFSFWTANLPLFFPEAKDPLPRSVTDKNEI